MSRTTILLGVLALAIPIWASAQDAHVQHQSHARPIAGPIEPGQDAFAAIAEIVTLLRADSTTDWTAVDIDALRAHLRDMSLVTLGARVSREPLDDGVSFTAVGSGETAAAIQPMTIAHAPILQAEANWIVSAEEVADGAILTVRSPDAKVAAMVGGLGYFGLMATGAHHQSHHLAMARGRAHPHH